MTDFLLISADDVRALLAINSDSTSRYSDATINSNIRASVQHLEKATGRYFADRPGLTYTRTTDGEPFVDLPGLRAITSATWNGAALTQDQTYWLSPDVQQSGVYTTIQIRPLGYDWFSSPEWFDRGLDPGFPGSWRNQYGYRSLPGDLVLVGDFGYTAATRPSDLTDAIKVMAAWKTKRPDALLSGGTQTPEGNVIPLGELPIEIDLFVRQWRIGAHSAVAV